MLLALLTATFLLGYSNAIIPNHVGHNIGHDIGQGIDRLGHGIGKIPEDLGNIGDTVIDGGLGGLKHAGDLLNPRGKRNAEGQLKDVPLRRETYALYHAAKHLFSDNDDFCASLAILSDLLFKIGQVDEAHSSIALTIRGILGNADVGCENIDVSQKINRALEEATKETPDN